MLIVCPDCATSYTVDAASLGTGRPVRCARCRTVWFENAREPALAAPPLDMDWPAEAFEAEASPEPQALGSDIQMSMPAGEPIRDLEGRPVAVADAPPLAPLDTTRPPAAEGSTAPPEDIESFAARRTRLDAARRRGRWPLSLMTTLCLGLFAVNAALIVWRVEVVRLTPQTASLYAAIGLPVNLRGLVFDGVTSTTEAHDGATVLVVEGTIVSQALAAVEVPWLRFALRDDTGQETYAWTSQPPHSALAPGDRMSFRSRLASPPQNGRDVMVRFLNRRDAVDGAR